MVYNIQNQVFGHCPSSGILKTRTVNASVDGVEHSELLSFWTLRTVWCSKTRTVKGSDDDV
jgi:hypothetical protein